MASADIAGVRLKPAAVEFEDAEPRKTHKRIITVQNISGASKKIRFFAPENKHFNLVVRNPDSLVATGLEVTALLEFYSDAAVDLQETIVLQADQEVVNIPVFVYKPQCFLAISGPVDFGNVVNNSKVVSVNVTLSNSGSLAGDFKLKYSGQLPVTITPATGTVPPNSTITAKVDFVAKTEGPFSEEAKVFLEGREPGTLAIRGNVVQHSLELLDPETGEKLDKLNFGSTYYGTDKLVSVNLFNNGPDVVNFVAILEEGAEGQEAGVDLTKSTAATLASKNMDKMRGTVNELTSLVSAVPSMGVLQPYSTLTTMFKFSPRFQSEMSGWKGSNIPPPRQDYVLFMYFDIIGSRSLLAEKMGEPRHFPRIELAMVGTALPVLVSLTPALRFDFPSTPVGSKRDQLFQLANESDSLPIQYKFKRVAHFSTLPKSGLIAPNQQQEIVFSFHPNQAGVFNTTQLIEILGPVCAVADPSASGSSSTMLPIHTIYIPLTGESRSVTKAPPLKYNPGITPLITNEVGPRAETSEAALRPFNPRAAVLNAPKSANHAHDRAAANQRREGTLMSLPNDRAKSLRPTGSNHKTLFTGVQRYSYIDPDFAYTPEEQARVADHRARYISFIQQGRRERHSKHESQEHLVLNNRVDIGIKPGQGLNPPRPDIAELEHELKAVYNAKPAAAAVQPLRQDSKLLSTKELDAIEETALSRDVTDGLNAVPLTDVEKGDCGKTLSAQQLRQVVIGPPSVDYGQVCVRSVNSRDLVIANNLPQHVHLAVHIDCRELRQTSPLSQVIPPVTKARLPLVFESNVKGRFQRNIAYTINGRHQNHVLIYADVVPVALSLSATELVLRPEPGMPAEGGCFRETVTLTNQRNHPAEFTWSPIIGDKGTAFSVRPATGCVEPHQDLQCEVVFHPSFSAADSGEFMLQVHGGNSVKLRCVARFGPTAVQFIDRRVLFHNVPLNMRTTRTAVLYNPSQNHAFFHVVDPCPFDGLVISPTYGKVPVGGSTELTVTLNPTQVIKFDSHLMVAFRGWKTLDLRIGGVVEPPSVDIDLKSFKLGGCYCGAVSSTPFTITNRASSAARVHIDLSAHRDFSIRPLTSAEGAMTEEGGVYCIVLEGGGASARFHLDFKPTEVAAYDFILPVSINETPAPTPASTPFPGTPTSTRSSHSIVPRVIPHEVITPRRRVVATALRQPLRLSCTRIQFEASALDEPSAGGRVSQSTLTLTNTCISARLAWRAELTDAGGDSVFWLAAENTRVVSGELEADQTADINVFFYTELAGDFSEELRIFVNDDSAPYRTIPVSGSRKEPVIVFNPPTVLLMPVPLGVQVTAQVNLIAHNYTSASEVEISLPDITALDGELIECITVTPKVAGQRIEPTTPCILDYTLTFESAKPVSFSLPVKFADSNGKSFELTVTATADNCILTCYPFLAKHRNNHKICTEQGMSLRGLKSQSKESLHVGDPMMLSIPSPNNRRAASASHTTSPSSFNQESSSYNQSDSYSGSTYPSTPRDGANNNNFEPQQQPIADAANQDVASRGAFPLVDSEEAIFHQDVLNDTQRWFSQHGWGAGPYPITVPHSLRSTVNKSQKQTSDVRKPTPSNNSRNPPEINSSRKDIKTVYDMIANLTGRSVPGVSPNQPLPTDPKERMWALFWQHKTMLNYLKSQGAMLSSIKPEYLLEPHDYHIWAKLHEWSSASEPTVVADQSAMSESAESDSARDADSVGGGESVTRSRDQVEHLIFESVSRRAWTDILLQVYKLAILGRVSMRAFRAQPPVRREPASLPNVNPDVNASNIYGLPERVLLAWLNFHYENERRVVWADNTKGGVPPARWIVNFDLDLLDGLVLGAVLAAFCPFLVDSHVRHMYTAPTTAEQCLHNALTLTSAFRVIGLDYDIQAIDLTDPNPVFLLMLVTHLFDRLPAYLPRTTVDFVGPLHRPVSRQVKVSNPATKPVHYHAFLAGRDAADFTLVKGSAVMVHAKGDANLTIQFKPRFLRSAEAVLCLAARNFGGAALGVTLAFSLRSDVDSVTYSEVVRSESPCYETQQISLRVNNPFDRPGTFAVVLVEAATGAESSSLAQMKAAAVARKEERKQSKEVKGRTDHGQRRQEVPSSSAPSSAPSTGGGGGGFNPDPELLKLERQRELSSFHCKETSIALKAKGAANLQVLFLPFAEGKRLCSVIFIDEEVGEFVYGIEATAALPLPQPIPFDPDHAGNRISSAAAASGSQGLYGGDDRIVYLRCEAKKELNETLHIPITNVARESALVVAAQQMMTEKEFQRRTLTGTLASGSVTAAVAALAEPEDARKKKSRLLAQMTLNPDGTEFSCESTSMFFKVPKTVFVPHPINEGLKRKKKPHSAAGSGRQSSIPKPLQGLGLNLDDGTVALPIKFKAPSVGHYPARVVLRSPNDTRVFHIEVSVSPEGTAAAIEFSCPAQQTVLQQIPIVNNTENNWFLQAFLKGEAFSGPSTVAAGAMQTSHYPLTFRPMVEGGAEGSLRLVNKTDGMEHCFTLTGYGDRPLALDNIAVSSVVKRKTSVILKVPNTTNRKHTFNVLSDCPFLSGPDSVTVLPQKSHMCEVFLTPLKRGSYSSVISFVAKDRGREVDEETRVSTLGNVTPQSSTNDAAEPTYQVWFSLDVTVAPARPEADIPLQCTVLSRMEFEVPLKNPTDKPLRLEVALEGNGLDGECVVEVGPRAETTYTLSYAPSRTGSSSGKLIFSNDVIGEFWYSLSLTGLPPQTTALPHMACCLGRWQRTSLPLENSTAEDLLLTPVSSNPNNFSIEVAHGEKISLPAFSTVSVPLLFTPSALGQGNHSARICFTCDQFSEWPFTVSGIGLLPEEMGPVSIQSEVNSNSTVIVPWRNPTDETVNVDVMLAESAEEIPDDSQRLKHRFDPSSPFCLLLKHTRHVTLAPRATLDIPVSFAPGAMGEVGCVLAVGISREDGGRWRFLPSPNTTAVQRSEAKMNLGEEQEFAQIRWLFPVRGVPQAAEVGEQPATHIQCEARHRVEERLEVTLTGVPANMTSSAHSGKRAGGRGRREDQSRPGSGQGSEPGTPEGFIASELNTVVSELSYELTFASEASREQLEKTLAVTLVRRERDPGSGLVRLTFNCVFRPEKPVVDTVWLVVRATQQGGVWQFPLRLTATEPPADDVIVMEAAGLDKTSQVAFRLHSHTTERVPFRAFFTLDSDRELWVTPLEGDLRPEAEGGTLFTLSFSPHSYGRNYHGKLVVQTAESQWSYGVTGTVPNYNPPQPPHSKRHLAGTSNIAPAAAQQPGRYRNYIRENLRLAATGVSSPLKGAPLMLRPLNAPAPQPAPPNAPQRSHERKDSGGLDLL